MLIQLPKVGNKITEICDTRIFTVRKSNVFTSVCQEFCPREGGVSPRQTPPLEDFPQQTPPPPQLTPWADTSPSRQTHTNADSLPPPETATAADGTHPTGMHSCFCNSTANYYGATVPFQLPANSIELTHVVDIHPDVKSGGFQTISYLQHDRF